MAWTREEAKKLAEKVFSYSKAPECEVWLDATQAGHTRFAANDVTTSGSARDLTIAIVSRGGGRTGTVRVNDTEAAALMTAVARSEDLMAAASVDPEWVDGLPAQKYPEIRAAREATRKAGAPERKNGVKAALELARGRKLAASGFSETTTRWAALASKKGNFGFTASTSAEFSTTMRTGDGTGSERTSECSRSTPTKSLSSSRSGTATASHCTGWPSLRTAAIVPLHRPCRSTLSKIAADRIAPSAAA